MILCLAQSAAKVEAIAIPLGALVLVSVVVVLAIKGLRRNPGDEWQRLYERAAARAASKSNDPGPLVQLLFHTYSGFLIIFRQTKHRNELPQRVALEYLDELHRYNLRRALVPYAGSIFVPLISFLEYRRERSRIYAQRKQPPSA
jgi:hypothetical protein